ncbi:MAG: acyl-CoA carboxylase subunit beta [Solirubrobacterales bacterium]|nr:acyl-CoA carboxylase subunit beta [Solirubrobacterales bacterium]
MSIAVTHEAPPDYRPDQPSGVLTPMQRLEALCDPGSLHVIRSEVHSRRMGDRARAGDGVIGAAGRVDGQPVFCYAQDTSFAGGSLGEAHADTVVRVLRLAGQAQVPVVAFIASAGARMQEGLAALGGYGRIFQENVRLSGKVPQISIIAGTSAGGGSYSPALTDFVVMTEDASMFLTGPGIVKEVMGEDVSASDLGGARVHERNGVSQFTVTDAAAGARLARDLLSHLPPHSGRDAEPHTARPGLRGDPGRVVPAEPRKVYDVRDVIGRIVDGGDLVEVSPRWARNMVVGFARLEGRSVGIVANQPRYLGGVLDADAAQKAARFVRTCNTFNTPLVVLVDTPGFMPGTRQESAGVIRHGAKLLHAFAEATVPRLTVVLRKAYGGAYITMNSKDLGAHFTFAWPDAELGVMGAGQAVSIINRRELAAAEDPVAERGRLANEYAGEHLLAQTAAREGFVDEIIEPADTRARLDWGLQTLAGRERPALGRGNIPL